MPFHFYFDLKEEISFIKTNHSDTLQKLNLRIADNFSFKDFENLSFQELKEMVKLAKIPWKFEQAIRIQLRKPGDDLLYSDAKILHDYKKWKLLNLNLTSKDEEYFIIKEDFLRDFLEQLYKDNLYLIMKFGCDSDGRNLSILLAGMEKRNENRMSSGYIECNSHINHPNRIISFGSPEDTFNTKISNFGKRFIRPVNPKNVGVAHNLTTFSGPYGLGLLDYYLFSYNPDNGKNEDIFIFPGWDNLHQNNFTALFSGRNDIYNLTESEWSLSKIYDFGGACCPPY